MFDFLAKMPQNAFKSRRVQCIEIVFWRGSNQDVFFQIVFCEGGLTNIVSTVTLFTLFSCALIQNGDDDDDNVSATMS